MDSSVPKGIQIILYSIVASIFVVIGAILSKYFESWSQFCHPDELCFKGFFESMFSSFFSWAVSILFMFIILKKLQIVRRSIIFLLGIVTLFSFSMLDVFRFSEFIPYALQDLILFPVVFGGYYLIFTKLLPNK